MESNQIAENIRSIRGRMAAAAERAGRDPGEILLVGASKMNDAAACRAAICGFSALQAGCFRQRQQRLSATGRSPL